MQRIRTYVAVVSLFAMLCLTSNAIAARRSDDRTPVRDAQSQKQQQKPQKAKPKSWVAVVLDELENKYSFPPP
jgi:adenylate kinase